MPFKNKRISFVFPGQGAQYIGMGMDFAAETPELLKPLSDFDNKNKTELLEIIKNGPEDLLKETRFTQPAILYHSVTAMRSLQKAISIKPDFVAGHSLGEFTALVANGVLDFNDALYLVHKRGEFMIKANEGTPFAMAACMGIEADILTGICSEVSAEAKNLVVAANYNTPDQTVISGTESGVRIAGEKAKEAGAKRVLPLAVGGPFHSPLISKASDWLAHEMDKINFRNTSIPVIANVDAKEYTDPAKIKQNLVKQVTSSVLWVDCIKSLVSLGTDLFIEFGPKKVVSGMIKKIDRNIEVMNVDTLQDLNDVKEKLELL